MNWKERPEVFAGGEFGLKVEGLIHEVTLTPWHLCDFNNRIADCKLIGRPVSDMTDEENEHIATSIIGSGPVTAETNHLIFLEYLNLGIVPPIFAKEDKDIVWRYLNTTNKDKDHD